jgi:hypothetical protein
MSRAMRDQGASIPHLSKGEIKDLRGDVDAAFAVLENRPALTRVTGGSTALSIAGLPTAKPMVGVDLLASKVQAALVINEGTTAELNFTSQRPGTPGSAISVQVVDSASGGLAVTAVAGVIEIDLGGATPDAATILAAMDALPAALNLVATAHDGTAGAGLPLVMAAAENLAGGTGEGFDCYVNGIAQTLGGPVTDTAVPMIVTDLTGAANLDQGRVAVITDGLELASMQIAIVT